MRAFILLLALTGCSSHLVKEREVFETRVVWVKQVPLACGKLASTDQVTLHGCADRRPGLCIIQMDESAPDWVVAEEFRHCFGYEHRK